MGNKRKIIAQYPKEYENIKQKCIDAEQHPHDRLVIAERKIIELTDAYQSEKLDNEYLREENEELRETIKRMRRNGGKR